jgi:hypothetical protein
MMTHQRGLHVASTSVTRSGEPVRIWSRRSYSSRRVAVFLEIGHQHYELDHVDPNLAEALRASLTPSAA